MDPKSASNVILEGRRKTDKKCKVSSIYVSTPGWFGPELLRQRLRARFVEVILIQQGRGRLWNPAGQVKK